MITLMILAGLVLMYLAIYTKNEDIEDLTFFGATDLILAVFTLVFNLSPVGLKRILLFLFGLLWSGLFLFIFMTGGY